MRTLGRLRASIGISLIVFLAACRGGVPALPAAPAQTMTQSASPAAGTAVDDFHGFLRFEHLSLEDGLSQSSVNAILQDRQGFLWFGTQDGLDRYDGYEIQVFRPELDNPNSLGDRWITQLAQDASGEIWIGTRLGGLNGFDPTTGRFIHYQNDPGNLSSISSNDVLSLLVGADGTIWVGTSLGLDEFDPRSGKFTHFRHYLPNQEDPNSQVAVEVNVIYQDARGELWLGTSDGLEAFDPATQLFHVHPFNPSGKTAPGSEVVTAIAPATDGGLWVGLNDALTYFDPANAEFTQLLPLGRFAVDPQEARVTALLDDGSGTVWVGTDAGLVRLDPRTLKSTLNRHNAAIPDSLASDRVLSLFQDAGEVIWVGSIGGGVDKYDRGRDKFYYYRNDPADPNSLSNNNVQAISVDATGAAWIGTDGGGLDRFDPITEKFEHFLHDPNDPGSLNSDTVWSVYRDQYGTLWVGTSAGLDQFDEQTGIFIHHVHDSADPASISGNTVVTVREDRSGRLWVGTNAGLDRFDRLSGTFIHYRSSNDIDGITQDEVVSFLEDARGDFWVGTFDKGLYRIDWSADTYTFYQAAPQVPGSLSSDSVMEVTQDAQGNLWVATAGGGLDRYLPASNSFLTYTERDGLPNAVVYSAVPDAGGSLWLSTNFGLARFDPQTKSFRNFTVSDGLQSNEFNMGAYARAPDGSIYFGGVNGFNIFYPDRIRDNGFVPPVILAALTQDGQPLQTASTLSATHAIRLDWPKNSFEFELAALSYAEPVKNQYAYVLQNFDSAWNLTGANRSGRYTNLPSGTYTLVAKASNNDGVWSQPVTLLSITIVPPIWQTWWFRLALAGLLGLAVVGSFQIRTKSIQHRNQQLEKLVQERTREIEALFEKTKELAIVEERNRLARDLHDSAKQKAFAALAQLGTADGIVTHNLPAGREHLKEAENLVYEVIQELTFLIQEMYPLALKEKGLINALREYVFEWENRTDIRVNLKVTQETRLPLNVEQALYRIVQEALANVARHSQAGRVELALEFAATGVTLVISDDGHGFDPGTRSNGIGLRLIRERTESINGQLTIASSTGNGTRILISIPPQPETKPGG